MKLKLTINLRSLDFLDNRQFIIKSSGNNFTIDCGESDLSVAGLNGPSVGGLLKLLNIPAELDATFVIVNGRIAFSDVPVRDGDSIEILPSITGG